MAGEGLVSMTPTSIAHSGTSATINADGGVDFVGITSVSLNGVFTSAHENYLVVIRGQDDSVNSPTTTMRLRAAGTDASGANYVRQFINGDSTSVTGRRDTGETSFNQPTLFYSGTANQGGVFMHLYKPYLAQPTLARTLAMMTYLGGYFLDHAYTHTLSTSYDGLTFIIGSDSVTGNIHVFGYEE